MLASGAADGVPEHSIGWDSQIAIVKLGWSGGLSGIRFLLSAPPGAADGVPEDSNRWDSKSTIVKLGESGELVGDPVASGAPRAGLAFPFREENRVCPSAHPVRTGCSSRGTLRAEIGYRMSLELSGSLNPESCSS